MKLVIALFFMLIAATATLATALVAERVDGKIEAYTDERSMSLAEVEEYGYKVEPDRDYTAETQLKKRYTKLTLFTYKVDVDTLHFGVMSKSSQ